MMCMIMKGLVLSSASWWSHNQFVKGYFDLQTRSLNFEKVRIRLQHIFWFRTAKEFKWQCLMVLLSSSPQFEKKNVKNYNIKYLSFSRSRYSWPCTYAQPNIFKVTSILYLKEINKINKEIKELVYLLANLSSCRAC